MHENKKYTYNVWRHTFTEWKLFQISRSERALVCHVSRMHIPPTTFEHIAGV